MWNLDLGAMAIDKSWGATLSSDIWQGNHKTLRRKAAKHEVLSCYCKPPELCSIRIHSLDPSYLLRQLYHSLYTAARLHSFKPTALGRAGFWALKPLPPQKLHSLNLCLLRSCTVYLQAWQGKTYYLSLQKVCWWAATLCYCGPKVQLTTSRYKHGGVLGEVKLALLPFPL